MGGVDIRATACIVLALLMAVAMGLLVLAATEAPAHTPTPDPRPTVIEVGVRFNPDATLDSARVRNE